MPHPFAVFKGCALRFSPRACHPPVGGGGETAFLGAAGVIGVGGGGDIVEIGPGIERKIEVVHIEPGRPVQNAHVKSFHGKLRDECLNASWFGSLFEARAKIGAWKEEYNEERPHSSLGYLAPREFARRVAALRSPTAPGARQLEGLREAEVMSSGKSGVV